MKTEENEGKKGRKRRKWRQRNRTRKKNEIIKRIEKKWEEMENTGMDEKKNTYTEETEE